MRIIVLSPNLEILFSPKQLDQLRDLGDTSLVGEVKSFEDVPELFSDDEKIVAIDPDFCDWKVPNEILDKIPNLKAVCLQTTSFNWIDVNHLAEKQIPVMNLRGFSSQAVAEWDVMMAINLARRIPLIVKDGWKLDYTKHQGLELQGRTAGIIGLGSIGTKIAEICDGMGMNVIYWSKNSRNAKYEFRELSELMATSDVVFPTIAQNEETSELLTDSLIDSMKPSAIFVSILHNEGIYNHDLVVKKVKEGTLFGYGFETMEVEFNDFEGNVWAGPQLAWDTKESFEKNAAQWLDSIRKAVEGDYENKIN